MPPVTPESALSSQLPPVPLEINTDIGLPRQARSWADRVYSVTMDVHSRHVGRGLHLKPPEQHLYSPSMVYVGTSTFYKSPFDPKISQPSSGHRANRHLPVVRPFGNGPFLPLCQISRRTGGSAEFTASPPFLPTPVIYSQVTRRSFSLDMLHTSVSAPGPSLSPAGNHKGRLAFFSVIEWPPVSVSPPYYRLIGSRAHSLGGSGQAM